MTGAYCHDLYIINKLLLLMMMMIMLMMTVVISIMIMMCWERISALNINGKAPNFLHLQITKILEHDSPNRFLETLPIQLTWKLDTPEDSELLIIFAVRRINLFYHFLIYHVSMRYTIPTWILTPLMCK